MNSTNTYENDNFIVEYSDSFKYLDEIVSVLDGNAGKIMNFFKLKKLDSKTKIIIWNSIETYKNHLIPFLDKGIYYDWMIADTYDGNINLVDLKVVQKIECKKDYNLNEFLEVICHEFTHICHSVAFNKFNEPGSDNDGWFWEAIAQYFGGHSDMNLCHIDCSLENLIEDYYAVDNGYSISYTIGQYLFKNKDYEYIYNLSLNPVFLREEANRIIDEANEWVGGIL